ncbi:MAG: PorT family protein [Bacteroidales bacterium]|nr:PorT family protein [Bacteroidales bacterium]
MKKIVFAAIAMFLIIGATQAQDKVFRFGLSGSAGMSWMKPDQDSLEYQGSKFSVGYGFMGEISLATNFALVTGFDVSYMGGKLQQAGVEHIFDTDTLTSIKNSSYKLQYLDIPLTLKMKTNEINYITYYARIGGSFGIALSGKAENEFVSIDRTKNETITIDKLGSDMAFLRANFVIGAGFEYSLGGTTTALVEASFTNGLTYLLDDTKAIGNFMALKLGIMF